MEGQRWIRFTRTSLRMPLIYLARPSRINGKPGPEFSHLLIAETNLNTAARVVDRLCATDRGEIIFEGDPGKAFENAEVMKTIRS